MSGVSALYSAPIKVFDLPAMGATVHIHGSADGNTLYGGDIRPIGMNQPLARLNGYESAMADLYAQGTGIPNKR